MKPNQTLLSRRSLLLSSLGLATTVLAGCSRGRVPSQPESRVVASPRRRSSLAGVPEAFESLYPALPDEQFPIAAIAENALKPQYRRQLVQYDTPERPGTVIVETGSFYLYHVLKDGFAMRYGVGLGRAGFAWSGRARIAWKRKWPKWTPPEEMIAREPELAKWGVAHGGMPPGLTNPLGARALYIFQGKQDTLYRLHGTPEVSSIGRAVSSGCVRLVNHDIIHLYDHVRSGSPLVVR